MSKTERYIRWRWLLIIPMAVIELLAIAVGWVLALCHKPTGEKWVSWWIKTLPDADWYYRKF